MSEHGLTWGRFRDEQREATLGKRLLPGEFHKEKGQTALSALPVGWRRGFSTCKDHGQLEMLFLKRK